MDFAFSPEQDMLREAARGYLADRYPVERVVELVDGEPGWDPDSWQQLAEMGWLDPDLGALEHAVLLEETGYALYPGPLFSTVALARPVLAEAGGTGRDAVGAAGTADAASAAGAAGARTATLAWAEQGLVSLRDVERVETSADPAGRLTGHKLYVPDGAIADEALVVARGVEGVGVYRLDLTAHGDVVVPRSTTDRSRRLAELLLDGTPADRVADADVLPQVRQHALAGLACEAVGVAQRCLDIAAAYANDREQFGRKIGSYQGVSHRIADIYVSLQLARSLAYWAAWCVAENDEQAPMAVAAAKSAAGEAAVLAAENAIQAMGGIGFTWDHPLHRYYKRAQWIDGFEGFGATHRAEIASVLLG